MKQKNLIVPLKASTVLIVLAMMAIYDQWENTTAWIYLALHGTYGILWLLKNHFFPDRSWERETGPAFAVGIVIGLILYWVSPWIITSQGVEAPNWLLAACISLNVFGVFFHFVSDMQKYIALQTQPDQLINNGLFYRTRNINYFGEFLIYLSFALLSMHPLPILILLLYIILVWMRFMRRKDQSLSKYPDFAEYKQRSKLFIPFLY
jgi:steroid 5-alpha reductase family enzyme